MPAARAANLLARCHRRQRCGPALGGLLILVGALLVSIAGTAQQPSKIYRVGLLVPIPQLPEAQWQKSELPATLRELGWIEGKNFTFEHRWTDEGAQRLDQLAADLVRARVDLIVAMGSAVFAAKRATTSIPIVVYGISDPVSIGLVTSLARPGGNITGITNLGADLWPKQLELLKEAVPNVTHIAILGERPGPTYSGLWDKTLAAARPLGVRLQYVEVQRREDFTSALGTIAKSGAGALQVLSFPLSYPARKQICEFALKRRLPTIEGFRVYAEAGCLMTYGVRMGDQARRAAFYIDKILKGANPAELPFEQAMTLELIINLKTAKVLGLSIPQSLLARADDLILR